MRRTRMQCNVLRAAGASRARLMVVEAASLEAAKSAPRRQAGLVLRIGGRGSPCPGSHSGVIHSDEALGVRLHVIF